MRLLAFVVFVLVMVLATCSAPRATPLPVQTDIPMLATNTELPPTPTEPAPSPKLPAASFESQTYVNESAGFALDYPAGWTVKEIVIGSRGTQVQFLSAPEVADMPTLPDGATRVNATLYQWEPRNDLAAFIANQKSAWESSGITVLEEKEVVLELGLPAVMFTIEAPEADLVYLITALQDRYLVLSGEGDLDLARQIMQRVRPIS